MQTRSSTENGGSINVESFLGCRHVETYNLVRPWALLLSAKYRGDILLSRVEFVANAATDQDGPWILAIFIVVETFAEQLLLY